MSEYIGTIVKFSPYSSVSLKGFTMYLDKVVVRSSAMYSESAIFRPAGDTGES
jgi:hypothetical protein